MPGKRAFERSNRHVPKIELLGTRRIIHQPSLRSNAQPAPIVILFHRVKVENKKKNADYP